MLTWNSRFSLSHSSPSCDANSPIAIVVLDDHPSPTVVVFHNLKEKILFHQIWNRIIFCFIRSYFNEPQMRCTYGIFECLNVEEKQLAADLFLIFCKKRLKKVKIYDVSKTVQNPMWKLKKIPFDFQQKNYKKLENTNIYLRRDNF
jgi:hypothetical protein